VLQLRARNANTAFQLFLQQLGTTYDRLVLLKATQVAIASLFGGAIVEGDKSD
jgi:hypothetical protein